MAISFPHNPPTTPGFRSLHLRLVPNATAHISPFTQQAQILEFDGYHWEGEFTLPSMTRAQAAPWIAWLAALRGPVGTFMLGDPDGASPRGTNLGTPKVQTPASAGARSFVSSGWTASKTGLLLPGDYFQVGNELKVVTASVDSDSDQDATIEFAPPLRAAVSGNQAITTTNAKGLFRLAGGQGADWTSDVHSLFGVTFSVIESLS